MGSPVPASMAEEGNGDLATIGMASKEDGTR